MDHEVAPPIGRKVNYGWIGESFELYKRDAPIWVIAIIISIVVATLVQLACRVPTMFTLAQVLLSHHSLADLPKPSPIQQFSAQLIMFLVDSFLYSGLYAMGNKAVRGQRLSLLDLFSNSSKFLSFLLYCIVSTFAMFLGFLACCVGFSWTYMMVLPGFAVLADDGNVFVALSKSIDGMKVDWFSAGLFYFTYCLLVVLSVLPFGLGLLVTAPMGYIIPSLAYRDMIGMPNYHDKVHPEEHQADESAWPPPPSGV